MSLRYVTHTCTHTAGGAPEHFLPLGPYLHRVGQDTFTQVTKVIAT